MGHVLNIHGVNDVRLDPVDPPRPGNSDVVVEVKACGVCGGETPAPQRAVGRQDSRADDEAV